MQSSSQHFTVNINGKKIHCKKDLAKMSTFLNNLLFLGMNTFDFGEEDQTNSQEQQIYIELVDQQTFIRFIQFCELNNYTQPAILTPIKSNRLQDFVDEKNFKFIQKYNFKSKQLHSLIKAAQFLACNGLLTLIAAKYAALIYFEDSAVAHQAKCKQLDIQSTINFEDNQRFKQLYPCMNS